jgi:autotransporter adhesin
VAPIRGGVWGDGWTGAVLLGKEQPAATTVAEGKHNEAMLTINRRLAAHSNATDPRNQSVNPARYHLLLGASGALSGGGLNVVG